MRPTEQLASLLQPIAAKRFMLNEMPDIRVETGAGLGSGVKFRVTWTGKQVGLIEGHCGVGVLVNHVKLGGQLKFDHNGSNHTVGFIEPLLKR